MSSSCMTVSWRLLACADGTARPTAMAAAQSRANVARRLIEKVTEPGRLGDPLDKQAGHAELRSREPGFLSDGRSSRTITATRRYDWDHTGARENRAERAAAAPPTVEPDPGNAGEGKVMELPRNTRYDAVVIGAGLIGLACAWRARRRGLSVLVVDRASEPGAAASRVAAGMLAPVTEADFGDEDKLGVNLTAREQWQAFAAELEEVTALPTGYRDSGALVVAADRDDAEALRRLQDFQRSLGLDSEWLTPSACRSLEPDLSPRIAGGIAAPQDGSADPRATVHALAAAAEEVALGVEAHSIE